jgi:hypothetical protein
LLARDTDQQPPGRVVGEGGDGFALQRRERFGPAVFELQQRAFGERRDHHATIGCDCHRGHGANVHQCWQQGFSLARQADFAAVGDDDVLRRAGAEILRRALHEVFGLHRQR